jgi:hypothetical protein
MVYFNIPNNLEHLRQRIRAEMEQISPDTIERSVHTMFTLASLSSKWLAESNVNILLLTLKSSQPTDIVIKPPPSARVF